MDAVSYSHSAKQAQRIEKFIKNPDSNSGIVTVPKVIGAGESVTIPAGRVAVLPNVQVDGTLTIEGEVFIPSGATFSKVVETEGNQSIDGIKTFVKSPIVPTPTTGTQAVNKSYADTKQSKSELSYNTNTSSFIPNTLSSGAIIEKGSNANGTYIKFADGTLICSCATTTSSTASVTVTYPHVFISPPDLATGQGTSSLINVSPVYDNRTESSLTVNGINSSNTRAVITVRFILLGKWK